MTPHNPGRARSSKRADPFAVVRDENGIHVVNDSLAVITTTEFAALQRILDSRPSPQARKRSDRRSTSPFLSRVVRCNDCDVYMCRGTNQERPVIYCSECRQTLSRTSLDPYLVARLLTERGNEPIGKSTIRAAWEAAGSDEVARRDILLTQLASLRVRRGIVGRRFDEARIVLHWHPTNSAKSAQEPEPVPALRQTVVS